MKALVFNTTEKHVTLYESMIKDKVILKVANASTVKAADQGFYEVFVKDPETGNGKPIVIIMKTEMGQGVDFMMGTHKWHGSAPNAEQLQNALGQLEETLGDY